MGKAWYIVLAQGTWIRRCPYLKITSRWAIMLSNDSKTGVYVAALFVRIGAERKSNHLLTSNTDNLFYQSTLRPWIRSRVFYVLCRKSLECSSSEEDARFDGAKFNIGPIAGDRLRILVVRWEGDWCVEEGKQTFFVSLKQYPWFWEFSRWSFLFNSRLRSRPTFLCSLSSPSLIWNKMISKIWPLDMRGEYLDELFSKFL